MSWTREQVLAMYAEYLADESLAVVGGRYDISHETVRQLFIDHGLARRSHAERMAQETAELERQAEAQRETIINLYKSHGTIDAVLERVKLPRRVVAPIINEIPNREAYRRRGLHFGYSREELLRALQRARDHSGEPLTVPNYRDAARTLGLPAYHTVIKYFLREDPDQPWLAALNAAGVKGNAPRGRRANAISPEECIQAVVRCIHAHDGRRVSYETYRVWALDVDDAPSGPSVRQIVGWSSAVAQALDILSRV